MTRKNEKMVVALLWNDITRDVQREWTERDRKEGQGDYYCRNKRQREKEGGERDKEVIMSQKQNIVFLSSQKKTKNEGKMCFGV